MKIKTKCQNQQSGYKIRTNQKAGLTCEGYMGLVDHHVEDCARNPDLSGACEGIGHDIKCMVDACNNAAVPCFR